MQLKGKFDNLQKIFKQKNSASFIPKIIGTKQTLNEHNTIVPSIKENSL